MDITGFDITILVASTIGIILMSFTFPALGLTGEETSEDEIPEFDVDADRFGFADEFPSRPNSPSSNVMTISNREEDENRYTLTHTDRIQGGDNAVDVYTVFETESVQPPDHSPRGQVWVEISNFSNGEFDGYTEAYLNDTGDYATVSRAGYRVQFHLESAVNWNGTLNENEGTRAVVSYEIQESPPEVEPLIERVPIIGSFFETGGGGIVGAVTWIANVLQWAVLTSFDIILNGLGMVFDVVGFMFGLADFLVTTYTEIVSAEGLAPWASVILVIPGIMLMAVWAKLAAVAVEVIWIG